MPNENGKFSISKEAQIICLKIARNSIEHYLKTNELPKYQYDTEVLNDERAVFVTLYKNGLLRGCIGTTMPQTIVQEAITQMAISAAFDDPRFPRVTESELKDINIEISILSPLKKIENASEIIQNVHGVLIKKGFRNGLFLPQVWEHFTAFDDFMDELCVQKAGLPAKIWKTDQVEMYTFEVFSFKE